MQIAADICATAAADGEIDMVAWAAPMPRKTRFGAMSRHFANC